MKHGTYVVIALLFMLTGCMPGGAPSELAYEDGNAATGTTGTTGTNRAMSLSAFKQTVYPLVTSKTCLNCHSGQSGKQSPIFADGDAEKAFDALTLSRKVDIASPALSRIYLKVKDSSHNCWSGDCAADSAEILAAIKQWAALAPEGGSTGGIATDTMKFPTVDTIAQTEYGTLLLQAEQDSYRSEVVKGRFFDLQDSGALDGKYLNITPIESNPVTQAPRSLSINTGNFNACREFIAADTEAATRAIRFMQDRVHIPSGQTTTDGKIVSDGYRPYTASISYHIIRPDQRIKYAQMITSGDYTDILKVVLSSGAPMATTKVVGQGLPATGFQGTVVTVPNTNPTNLKVLPYFVDWSTVYNADKTYKTTGTYVNDDGDTEPLHTLFKTGGYSPDQEILQSNFVANGALKRDNLYRHYRETVQGFFLSNATTRRTTYTNPYSQFLDADISTYLSPIVDVRVVCPPAMTCDTENKLKYKVTESGNLLTMDNALDCYSLNAGGTALVAVAANNCNGNNKKYFHYIDLFIRPYVAESFVTGTQSSKFYTSDSPATYKDFETFTGDGSKTLTYNNVQSAEEMDPDALFAGADSLVSDSDNLTNFSSTLHNTLKTTRCVDCHGNTPAAGAPSFVNSSAASALSALKAGGYIDFNTPRSSFRPGTMVHNCNGGSADPKYSCATADEDALRVRLVDSITAWKAANVISAQSAGTKSYRVLATEEKLPGRVKYKFKVTKAGLHNVWMKVKRSTARGALVHFRVLDSNNNAVSYSTGSSGAAVGTCFKWDVPTTNEVWEWSTPGRSAELSVIDSRGYLLLDNNKNPLALPNSRSYFNLAAGDYTLDVIGLTENLKLDAVGINQVENLLPDSRLVFQPDRRAIDEKNIADYKRRILRFDLTSQLGLTGGKSAYFEIEVKKQFGNQNYVFRNPRFMTSPRDFNISMKGIKVFINGKWSFPDATYNNIEYVTGDNQVLTYAPLVALTSGPDDLIHFQFDKLAVTTESLSIVYPKGTAAAAIVDRRCNDLDYFVKNVKPILRSVKVSLNSEIDGYNGGFPGNPENLTGAVQVYNCTSCHTANHPYFKMANFTNDEEFCREALSRVDFDIFAQSLVIRGINGTGNHPKFVFIEKFVNDAQDNFKQHDDGQDFMLNRYKNPVGIASNLYPGARMMWSKEDIVPGKTTFSSLTATEKLHVAKAGLFRKSSTRRIDPAVMGYSWYTSDIHNEVMENGVLGSHDVVSPDPLIGRLDAERRKGKRIYDLLGFDGTGMPITADNFEDQTIPLKATQNTSDRANAQPRINYSTVDYISTTPAQNTRAEMLLEYEGLRDYYREKVISWIRRENALRD